MISFADLTKQVHLINDLILSDMVRDSDGSSEELTSFSRHLLATKNWFSRISWANKKRYLLALLEDVRSAWTLSVLLKSLWNCRPKDAILSVNEKTVWSSYDQVPMDHNRTALPVITLAQVMKSDRIWFLSLEPEAQAMVLSELLTVGGGPVMWVVLQRAQVLYERYRNEQLQNLQECIVVNDHPQEKATHAAASPEKGKKDASIHKNLDAGKQATTGLAQKELDANLAAWSATIKSMRDSLKLEELEITFNDGTKRKVWKVNRPKPEVVETVDFLQLLPACIGKRVISYLPRAQLGDYAKVNRYWSLLVDEFKAELTVKQKIDTDFEKLNDIMLRHDMSLELVEQIEIPRGEPLSSQGNNSAGVSLKHRMAPPSMKASEKSAGAFSAYSMRHFLNEKLTKPIVQVQTPIRNLAEMRERLERRGAADDNLWNWCENVLKNVKVKNDEKAEEQEGIMPLGNLHFPCPLMKQCLEVPLHSPLYKDPAVAPPTKPRKNISNQTVMPAPKEQSVKRYSLWTRDFSSLYPVFKIPCYQSPI